MLARLESVTPPDAATRPVASALVAFHATMGDRHRRGVDLGPSSVPVGLPRWKSTVVSLLPSNFGLTPNTAGYGVWGWEVRRNLGTWPTAISAPLHYRPRSQIGRDALGHNHDLLVQGMAIEHKAIRGWIRSGLEVDWWFWPKLGVHDGYMGETYGAFASALGVFNVSVTSVPGRATVFHDFGPFRPGGTPLVLTVGVGRFNSMFYWGFLR
jgi:hypothetical protein